ncbi:MAG: aminodeoxychorismate/anthranilate synthase component II [Bacteroidetes bacterium HGW-Bacteroidetes-21]|nr:MAG: aminodeoxychorismate/anthranilate synthase component II [Bacteroidetes bacterium HGW-Bacteroidetes-21]
MRIAIIDNYDSFTWNLFHYIEPLASEVVVFRNDVVSVKELNKFNKIVISPGPGMPSEIPLLKDVVLTLGRSTPILGVCLGHQAIVEAFGGKLKNLPEVWHGIVRETRVIDKQELLFKNLPEVFETGHYHSWVVSPDNFPDCLEITAVESNGEIIAVRHKEYPIWGVQFHPESVLTAWGKKIIENWVMFK